MEETNHRVHTYTFLGNGRISISVDSRSPNSAHLKRETTKNSKNARMHRNSHTNNVSLPFGNLRNETSYDGICTPIQNIREWAARSIAARKKHLEFIGEYTDYDVRVKERGGEKNEH